MLAENKHHKGAQVLPTQLLTNIQQPVYKPSRSTRVRTHHSGRKALLDSSTRTQYIRVLISYMRHYRARLMCREANTSASWASPL